MAGIVLESIGVCGRATNCLRFLRVSQRPFVLCPSWATLQHRCRRHCSFDGAADEKGKDQPHQTKTIHLGEGQLAKKSDGLKVTAAPPDPKQDTPGEKRTELPYEVRPEIPLEAQPNRIQPTPLEVKPSNPQPIICSSDYEAFDDVDPDIESEPKSHSTSSNELPPPPVINLMDDQTQSPSPTTTKLDKSIDCPFISIECDQNYPSTTVHDARYQAPSPVKSEPTSQGSSSDDPKTGISESQIKSKDGQNSQASHLNKKYDLKTKASCIKSDPNEPTTPVTKEPGSIATLELEVKPHERKADYQPSISADNSQRSSLSDAVGSQLSSFDLPGEGKTVGKEQQVGPTNYSSAKDGYESRYDQIYCKDQDKTGKTSENIVDNEMINQWVDKFKRLYLAENAAFGLNHENEKQNSGSKDKKDRNRLQTMVMKDNKWVFGNKDTAKPSPFTPDKSSPGGALPLNIRAKHDAPGNIKDKNRLQTMVLKDNKWVFEKKDTAETRSTPYDPNFQKNSRSSHEGDLPLDIETDPKAFRDQKDEKRLLSMVKKDNKWVSKDIVEPGSSQRNTTSPEATLPLKKEAKPESFKDEQNRKTLYSAPKDVKDENSPMSMIKKNDVWVPKNKDTSFSAPKHKTDENSPKSMLKKNNVWVLRNKDTSEPVTPSSGATLTNKSSPGRTLPLKIISKHETPAKLKKPKIDLPASPKDAPIDTSKPINIILDQSPAAEKSKIEVSGSPAGNSQGNKESSLDYIAQEKYSSKTTEEIVAMFKDDYSDDLNKMEVGETLDGMTISESTKDSQADFLGSLNTDDAAPKKGEKLDQAHADKKADEYFSEILDFSDSHEAEKAEQKNKFISSSDSMGNSYGQTKLNSAKRNVSCIKASNNSDSSKKDLMSFTDEIDRMPKDTKEPKDTSQTETTSKLPGDLYYQIPHETAEEKDKFISSSDSYEQRETNPLSLKKASDDSDSSELNPMSKSFTDEVDSMSKDTEEPKDTIQTEITTMLPDDLYDPLAKEEIAGVEESEHLNPDQEAPEVKNMKGEATVPTPFSRDETKTKGTERPPTEQNPVRKEKPQLEQGELSMKLLDLDSVEPPTSAAKTPPSPQKKPSPAEKSMSEKKIPDLGAESRTPGQKSLIQKLFEKILGGRGKNDGKRQMSTYTAKRLSTGCTFAIPQSGSPNVAKDFGQDSLARTLVTMGSVSEFHEESPELKPAKVVLQEPDILPPELDLFAKKSKDLTEIKGGSLSCKSPKKTPLELLREKQNSKEIKILGGSKECEKKLKDLKELTENTDDDCDRDHFSISKFVGKLRVSFAWSFYSGDRTDTN